MSRYRDILSIIVLAAIWSSSFAAIKIGVSDLPPSSLVAARVMIAAAVLYAYMRVRGGRLPSAVGLWGGFFLFALFGNTIPFSLISWGEQGIDSALAAILMANVPLFTLLLSHFFIDDEPMTVKKVFGVMLGFAGVLVLIGPDALTGMKGTLSSQLAVAGGALCYAIASLIAKRLAKISPVDRSAGVMIASSVQIVPLALYFDHPWTLAPDTPALAAVVYLGIFPTALASILLFQVIDRRGASYLALSNYLIPAMGVMWGAVLLGETLHLRQLFALGLILVGIAVSSARANAVSASPGKVP
ncbi:DMT family transporter [Varunaivibrio sulfuroxidans]|uniref:Drug/metabolite transporter (DMT)-like permease n=1 Tax=Varunaivibrio sulfuroxidans TaxID=1773489 RepID=A0A4V2UNR3_9PROT|nr:EamA family transporter [Varunaivibrio sulfuroxidans]TCS63051.1 drug/metabolite transporter (DMT)-like permease [Varunaivibrio sulfuroxidans]WES31877.1 EamA family transporter [Varunaivibrio sulfuroxidans]